MTEPTTQRVQTRRVNPLSGPMAPTTLEQDLVIARTVADLMDSRFEFAGVKFGLDAVIGLIPVVGDAVAFAIGMYPVHIARKHRLGKVLIARMMLNLGADFLVGVTPVIGDALDVAFKANLMNLKLLEKAARKRGIEE